MKRNAVLIAAILAGCSAPAPDPWQAQLEADAKRQAEKVETARRADPALNWVGIGISTGKYSEDLATSVHKTHAECMAASDEESTACVPIAALPASYWNAGKEPS